MVALTSWVTTDSALGNAVSHDDTITEKILCIARKRYTWYMCRIRNKILSTYIIIIYVHVDVSGLDMRVVFLRMMCPFGDNESGDISNLATSIDENFLGYPILRQHYYTLTYTHFHVHVAKFNYNLTIIVY